MAWHGMAYLGMQKAGYNGEWTWTLHVTVHVRIIVCSTYTHVATMMNASLIIRSLLYVH
jgi:hypothetical protein